MHLFFLRATLVMSALAAVVVTAAPAAAWTSPPALNPANGHYYAFFNAAPAEAPYNYPRPKLSFADAIARASQMSHLGIPGHLVTITSQSEQEFIFESFQSLVGNPPIGSPDKPFHQGERFWIGASDAAAEGEWRWTTGPEAGQLFWRGNFEGTAFGYHNWPTSRNPLTFTEPNDSPQRFGLGEDFGSMILRITSGGDSSWWNDVSTVDDGGASVPRLGVVEFSPVPEPASAVLIACGVFALLGARRIERDDPMNVNANRNRRPHPT